MNVMFVENFRHVLIELHSFYRMRIVLMKRGNIVIWQYNVIELDLTPLENSFNKDQTSISILLGLVGLATVWLFKPLLFSLVLTNKLANEMISVDKVKDLLSVFKRIHMFLKIQTSTSSLFYCVNVKCCVRSGWRNTFNFLECSFDLFVSVHNQLVKTVRIHPEGQSSKETFTRK